MTTQARHARWFLAFLVTLFAAVVGLFSAAPASGAPAAYTYDPPAYTYDAPVRLLTSHASDGPARASPAGPGVASWVSHTSVGRFGVAAETGAGASASVGDLLMPGGSAIGKAGTSANIREITGGLPEAQTMFNQLSQGGRVVAQTPSLTRVQLPDGGFVQLRTIMSRSPNTAATIDVNISGIDITKLKFNP